MRHRKKRVILGRESAARRALFRQLAISLIDHGRITTTVAKAKALRPFVERLVTRARGTPSLARQRQLLATLDNRRAVTKLLKTIAPKYSQRPGGYTRIIKRGRRSGDGSPTALIEFIQES